MLPPRIWQLCTGRLVVAACLASVFFPSLDDFQPDLVRAAHQPHLTPVLTWQLLAHMGAQHLSAGKLAYPVYHAGAVSGDLRDVPVFIEDRLHGCGRRRTQRL